MNCVSLQGEKYTLGDAKFDSLTDLIENYKKSHIEEVSGACVYLKKVRTKPHYVVYGNLQCYCDTISSILWTTVS